MISLCSAVVTRLVGKSMKTGLTQSRIPGHKLRFNAPIQLTEDIAQLLAQAERAHMAPRFRAIFEDIEKQLLGLGSISLRQLLTLRRIAACAVVSRKRGRLHFGAFYQALRG